MSVSSTRSRSRSFLHDPPSSDIPSGSILLNGSSSGSGSAPQRDASPRPSSSSDHSQSETESIATRASTQSVSFAPLPVIPPELKRRSSITLGVAARKHLLSSPDDEIYATPGGGGGGGRKPAGQTPGGVQKVYMNDADWEEYKRHHDEKNGNNPVDLGDLVTNGAKNLWRKVRSSPSPSQKPMELGTSPTPSNSSLASTSAKTGSSPSPSNSLLNNVTSPRISMRRRGSDPVNPAPGSGAATTTTKPPGLPDLEEETLSRMQSAEPPLHTEGALGIERGLAGSQHPDSHLAPPSPPPRVEDILPSTDEIKASQVKDEEWRARNHQRHDMEGQDDEVGGLGLEKVDIRSEVGEVPEWKQDWASSKRDTAVLGFDRWEYGGGRD